MKKKKFIFWSYGEYSINLLFAVATFFLGLNYLFLKKDYFLAILLFVISFYLHTISSPEIKKIRENEK